MKSPKFIAIIALSFATICASVALVVVFSKRATIARARVATAEANEESSRNAARVASAEATSALAKKEASENELKKATQARLQAEAEAARAKSEQLKAEAARAKAANDRAIADIELGKAKIARDVALAEKDKANELAIAESAKKETAEATLAREKLLADKIIAEAKLLELRQKDLAFLEAELLAYKSELDMRERMLRPEKTIADLEWVSKDDLIIAEDGSLKRLVKEEILPENDLTLAKETRALAKSERIIKEQNEEKSNATREHIVDVITSLYKKAVESDNVVEAEFYKKTLKALYPNWTP